MKGRQMANRWRTKSVEQSLDDTDDPETRLHKDLTWWDLTVFGVAVVIGAQAQDSNLETSLRLARHAEAHGAAAIISLPPAKVSEDAMVDYYRAVGAATAPSWRANRVW